MSTSNQDMEILTKLKMIKHMCKTHRYGCSDCVYFNDNKCDVKEVCYELPRCPADWDIDKIEKVIYGNS